MSEQQPRTAVEAATDLLKKLIKEATEFDPIIQGKIRDRDFSEQSVIEVMHHDMVIKLTAGHLQSLPEGTLDEELMVDLLAATALSHASAKILTKMASAAAADPPKFQMHVAFVVANLCLDDPVIGPMALGAASDFLRTGVTLNG